MHQSLLAGLLSHLGMRASQVKAADARADPKTRPKRRGPAEFDGARGSRFAIFPDSVAGAAAAGLGDGRRAGRDVAAVGAGRRRASSRSGPRPWPGRWPGAATASRTGTPGAARRWPPRRSPCTGCRSSRPGPISYGRVNPAEARELFIRSALVEGDWSTRHRFFHENRRLLDEAEDLERRARRRGIVADDAALFDFYDDRIPASVTSARHFDSWWKRARLADPDLLTFSPAELVGPAAEQVRLADYPGRWSGLPLSTSSRRASRTTG